MKNGVKIPWKIAYFCRTSAKSTLGHTGSFLVYVLFEMASKPLYSCRTMFKIGQLLEKSWGFCYLKKILKSYLRK